jgi:hypothetical protein
MNTARLHIRNFIATSQLKAVITIHEVVNVLPAMKRDKQANNHKDSLLSRKTRAGQALAIGATIAL